MTTYRTKCPACSSSNYTETTSREECKACGYMVDYHGGGVSQAAEDYSKRCDQRAKDAEYESHQAWLREEGYII